jgi:predicted  nucleic acid-binding Zn-ribbon protein
MHWRRKSKIIQANKDLTKLQKVIKDKEKLVDELKSDASKTERAYEDLQTKHKDLKTDKSRIEQEIKQKASRLGELEGYAVKFNEDTEAVLYVMIQFKRDSADYNADWISSLTCGNIAVML